MRLSQGRDDSKKKEAKKSAWYCCIDTGDISKPKPREAVLYCTVLCCRKHASEAASEKIKTSPVEKRRKGRV